MDGLGSGRFVVRATSRQGPEELAVESIRDEIIWLSYISLGQRLGYFVSVP